MILGMGQIFTYIFGRRFFQPSWERLLSISLRAMNVGCGSHVHDS